MKRIVEITNKSYLSVKHDQLVVEQNGSRVGSVPIEDLGVLVLNNPAIVISQQAVIASQEGNVAIIFCDNGHKPISTLLPDSTANSLHTKILSEQIAAKQSTKDRLWQSIVKEKLRNQSHLLTSIGGNHAYIDRLIPKVKSGDPSNIEAQAARHYWKQLFGNDFIRRSDDQVNACLNYGYAIVRACVARSIAVTGLHPSIGLNHKNQYNPLVLADDLMEPIRPWIDEIVLRLHSIEENLKLDQTTKRELITILETRVVRKDTTLPLMTALNRMASDLRIALKENLKSLDWYRRP